VVLTESLSELLPRDAPRVVVGVTVPSHQARVTPMS
jgi:hypothetical protein